MGFCIFSVSTTKPTAAKWTAPKRNSGDGEGWRDLQLAIYIGPRAFSPWPAHFFLPYADLSRTRAHDHRPHPRTPGNIRSRNRAQAAHQSPQRWPDLSYPRPFLAGIPRPGNHPRRRAFHSRSLEISRAVHRFSKLGSSDFHELHSGHAALPHLREMVAALIAGDPRLYVAGLARARFPGGRGIAGSNFWKGK